MNKRTSTFLNWSAFLIAAAVLVAASRANMQSHSFNQFMLLLLAVPAAMLLLLAWISRNRVTPSEQSDSSDTGTVRPRTKGRSE